MKSEKANKYLMEVTRIITILFYPDDPEESELTLREARRAVEIAEQDAEERMQARAHKIIKEMMDGVFHGDMPQKIADEFIQKLNEDEKR